MKIRFCLIGSGRAGLVHARNLANRIKNGELTAICDPNTPALDEACAELGVGQKFTDYREACAWDGCDAVVIVTPTHLHREIACTAAAAGKHVFLEKPMALNIAECTAINEAVAKAGVRLQIGFMRRFDEGFMRAKELLESGTMGRVMVIKSTGRGPGLPPPWIYDVSRSNGILAEVNSHDFDSVQWLAGSDITRVYAEAGNFKCRDAAEQWPDFYDNAVVSLRFADGAIGTIDGTCPCHYGYDARVEVLCEKGVLTLGSIEQHNLTEVSIQGRVCRPTVKSWRNLFRDAYLAEMEDFIDCIATGRMPRVTGMDGLRTAAAVVAANRSIREGKPIAVEAGSVTK